MTNWSFEKEKLSAILIDLRAVTIAAWSEGFKSTRSFWLLMFIVAIVVTALIRQCTYSSDAALTNHVGTFKKPPTVVLATAHHENVPVYISALGSVTPLDSVTIKTQVSGQLTQVLFREGQTVKTSDLLIEIDSRPYEAQLTQYEGQLARDKAILANARLDLERYRKLSKQDAVSKQTLDTQTSLVKQYEGTVKSDQGQVANARVNLSYCRITSPINGRVGLRLVDPGNFVQPSDPSGLIVINTIRPITVVFSIPEDSVPQVMKAINSGKTLMAEAYDRAQSKLLTTGTLLTIDNQIDPTTGMVKLKAQFQNDDDILFPNQFVNIRLLVDQLSNVTTIPTAAIQHGVHGSFVYVVNADHIATIKPVVVGVTTGDNTVVTSGIAPGQFVVIEGTDKLTDGIEVAIPHDKQPAPPSQNPTKKKGSI